MIRNAQSLGVTKISVCGVCPGADWESVFSLHEMYPNIIVPSVALHPWWISQYFQGQSIEELVAQLIHSIQGNEHLHVGECGLDKIISKSNKKRGLPGIPMERQQEILWEHIKVAHRFGRTISIHCVHAWSALEQLLLRYEAEREQMVMHATTGVRGILLHSCNSIPMHLIPSLLRIPNVYFSFSAFHFRLSNEVRIRLQRCERFSSDAMEGNEYLVWAVKEMQSWDTSFLRDVAEYPLLWDTKRDRPRIPWERLLLETDAPDQEPVGYSAPNASHESGYVAVSYLVLAAILRKPLNEIVDQLNQNARRCFGHEEQ